MKHLFWLSLLLSLCFGSVQAQNLVPFRYGDLWGFSDNNGKVVIKPVWDEVEPYEYGHALVRLGDKWGIINPQGKLIIKPQFDNFSYLTWETDSGNFRLFYLKSNNVSYRGVANVSTGEVIIPPIYTDIDYMYRKTAPFMVTKQDGKDALVDFSGKILPYSMLYSNLNVFPETFLCSYRGKYGVARKDGTLLLPLEFDTIFSSSDGVALIKKAGKYSFVKADGSPLFSQSFSGASSFSGGIALAKTDSLYGVIRKNGKWLKEPFASGVTLPNSLGYFAFMKDGKVGIMGPNGQIALKPSYDAADITGLGSFWIYTKTGDTYLQGLAGQKGEILMLPIYTAIYPFQPNGITVFNIDGKMGLVDKEGKIIAFQKYEEIYSFNKQGVAVFKLNGKYGLIGEQGNELCPAIYEQINEFDKRGLAITSINKKAGAVALNGKSVLPNEFSSLTHLSRGYYQAIKEDKSLIYDSTGQLIFHLSKPAVIHSITKSGLIITKVEGSYKVWSLDGNPILDDALMDYIEVDTVGIAVKLDAGGFHFLNAKSKKLSREVYSDIDRQLTGNLIRVMSSSNYGFINLIGEEVVPPMYRYTASGKNSISLLKGNQVGFIDFDGKWIIPLKYDHSLLGDLYFSNGICKVASGDRLFYIDSTGKEYYMPFIDYTRLPSGFESHSQRGIQQIAMKSAEGKEYQILVGLPENYQSTNKRYPILFLTDADYLMGSCWEIMTMLSKTMEIPEFIIVGIAYGSDFNTWYNRRIDELCPTEQSYTLFNGGGESKLLESFLSKELIPYINSNFRTIPEFSTYIGYSFGGLFGASLLVYNPSLFKDYILISPSIWWDDNLVLKQAEEGIQPSSLHEGRVFITLGEKESESSMKSKDFYNLLIRKQMPGLLPEYHTMPGQTHNSTFQPALILGLKELYGL